MANETFWFIFPDKPTTKRYIDEPINFGDADFQLNRKEDGMGMDASISGGEFNFRFTIYRNHCLEEILYWYHKDGFEADVKFGFLTELGNEFVGDVDFYTADTNDFNRFDCSVILESEMQIFKRRSETKVNMFSNTTIDGEVIEPLTPIPMLLKAKPVEQLSEWKQASQSVTTTNHLSELLNITQSLVSSGIQNSFVPFNQNSVDRRDYKILTAQTKLKNVKINIKNIDISILRDGIDWSGKILLFKGVDPPPPSLTGAVLLKTIKSPFIGNVSEYSIGDMENGESLWLFLHITQITGLQIVATIRTIETSIISESVAYNSTPLTFRLIDVMRQIAKSISGLDINAPRYDFAGEFYDTVLTNGKLLGGNTTDPFYVSWDDIEKSIRPEHNADSEIQIDKRVFVGIEQDFFTGEECGFFDNTQFSALTKKANPVYCLNQFKFKYSKYQSLKENTEPNSGSTIHGESIFTPFNKKVENSKECAVEWTRDAILLDTQQRLSTKISDDTATQDDDTIFAIDTIETTNDQKFTETSTLSHTFSDPYLSIRSNGEVNFIVLGIKESTVFIIEASDANSGNYTVVTVTNNELVLSRNSGNTPSTATNGIRLTKYTYEIKKESIPITNRTDEGFTFVLNLMSPDKYSNLRFSLQRNIRNYWNSFLASVNLYHSANPLKNTFYKNNGGCDTEYAGLRVIEKEDWIPTNPIVTPMMYEGVTFANVDYEDYKMLQEQLRTRRGFVRTIDNNERVLKLYPLKMSYTIKNRELTVTGQEKFEPAYLTIRKQSGIITVNEETKLRKLIYDAEALERDSKVILFDLERQRLYNGIYWDKVSINGALPQTKQILKSWLDLLN